MQAGLPKRAQVCRLLPAATPRVPGGAPGTRTGREAPHAREPTTSRGGGKETGAGARPSPTPSQPPPTPLSTRPASHLPGEGAQCARCQEAALETR